MSQKQQVMAEAAKAAPPWGVSAWAWFSSVPLDKWVQLAALLYTVLQIYFLLRDRRSKRRPRK